MNAANPLDVAKAARAQGDHGLNSGDISAVYARHMWAAATTIENLVGELGEARRERAIGPTVDELLYKLVEMGWQQPDINPDPSYVYFMGDLQWDTYIHNADDPKQFLHACESTLLAALTSIHEQAVSLAAGEPAEAPDPSDHLRLGLEMLAGTHCTNFTGPNAYNCFANGRFADARYGADQACPECIADAVLNARTLPTEAPTPTEPLREMALRWAAWSWADSRAFPEPPCPTPGEFNMLMRSFGYEPWQSDDEYAEEAVSSPTDGQT